MITEEKNKNYRLTKLRNRNQLQTIYWPFLINTINFLKTFQYMKI